MLLDELLGAGASASLLDALDPPGDLDVVAQELELELGAVRVTLLYRRGTSAVGAGKVDLYGPGQPARFVHLYLDAGAQRRGVVTRLADRFVAWCADHGIPEVVAHPADDAARRAFVATGAVDRGELVAWSR